MKKVKWLKINSNLNIIEIKDLLSVDAFDENKSSGYTFTKIRNDLICGQFIEKSIVFDRYYTFFNEFEEVKRTEYKRTEFTIISDNVLILTIIDPPRTIKPLLLSLTKNLGIGTSIEELSINPLVWAENSFSSLPINISQIDISNITINRLGTAKMQIIGSEDLRSYYHSSISQQLVTIDRVFLTIISPDIKGKIKLFKTGMAHINTIRDDNIIDILRYNLLH